MLFRAEVIKSYQGLGRNCRHNAKRIETGNVDIPSIAYLRAQWSVFARTGAANLEEDAALAVKEAPRNPHIFDTNDVADLVTFALPLWETPLGAAPNIFDTKQKAVAEQ